MSDPKGSRETGYLPIRYPEEEPYWQGLDEGRLKLQRCLECSKVRFPISDVCPNCLSARHEWEEMSGRGAVSTYVVFWKAWAPWMESRVPYVVAQVELPEGPRLTTNILNIEPNAVRIGLEVSATYERRTEEITLLQFEPPRADDMSEASTAGDSLKLPPAGGG